MTFKAWLTNMWNKNREEHDQWGLPQLTMQQYWTMYKWWLRREYRYYQQTQGVKK
jgi:hypothetical protein